MSASQAEVRSYYDHHIADKLRDFVEGNDRIERAWATIEQWAPKNPRRILELGCGIGHVTARLSRHWPAAEVTGLDVSPKSLEIARALFSKPGICFVEGPLMKGMLGGKYDLVVLMDVYEHIAREDRSTLHAALAVLQHEHSRTILTFPTPRALSWSRKYHPHTVQPVDEDIDLDAVRVLASDLHCSVLLYQEADVWNEGDYAHVVLGTRNELGPALEAKTKEGVIPRVRRKLLGDDRRSRRLALVHERLGKDAYR